MKLTLTNFSIRHPWWVMAATAIAVIAFSWQIPKVTFDNDPENMLAPDEPVRLLHDRVKETFSLYDFVIVGVVNEEHPEGVFNPETLTRVHQLTHELLSLHERQGQPVIRTQTGEETLDLTPDSVFQRFLNVIFRQNPNRLFDESGESVIIERELISPSVVDNLKQAELGALKLEYLMEEAPTTQEEADRIRRDAMGTPLYRGTLVSEDGQALCIYIPIKEKTYSYNVANLVKDLTADWPASDQIHITGLPVAEDTFGVEMLIQMATSAPLAGLTIFIMLLIFFRRFDLILAPMAAAVVSVICTMGLLIGLGFDVHIMSSMIAIFLMPIAVVDSVHILSEFFDTYRRFHDKAKTIRHVVGHLFMPMLYTSLTTMAGFASLGLTPIPPVRVFGLHVAFGVGLAWLLTMTFIPAFIMLFVREASLERFGREHPQEGESHKGLMGLLARVGGMTRRQWKPILVITVCVIGVSIYGISRISINDNPVKWFTPSHPIRVADRVLNDHFGGTYTAYLTLAPVQADTLTCREKAQAIADGAEARFADLYPDATRQFVAAVDRAGEKFGNLETARVEACFAELVDLAEELDERLLSEWRNLADEVLYLDPEGLTYDQLTEAVQAIGQPARSVFLEAMQAHRSLTGKELQDRALEIADQHTQHSFREFVLTTRVNLEAPPFKRPEVLHWVASLQEDLARHEVVGKSSSAVDALQKANYELNYREPPPSADTATQAEFEARNDSFFAIPETPSAVAQVYIQLEGTKKKDSLFHLVTRDYESANIWVQLTSGDNQDMEVVLREVDRFIAEHPPPIDLRHEWAGLTYLNVVWQDKMVSGMLSSLASSFVVVLIMMTLLFRSFTYGLLSMIPLSVTIAFIYGLIGIIGKDYDMPVAVLSSLTLGLSVDFAIHFLQRAREATAEKGSWAEASEVMFAEPATAIARNALVIAIGFLPLLIAPLVPYQTVGFFLATIMAVSGLATLFILPAMLTMLQGWLFKPTHTEETS